MIRQEVDLAMGAALAQLKEDSPVFEAGRLARKANPSIHFDAGKKEAFRRLLSADDGIEAKRERMDIDHERLTGL